MLLTVVDSLHARQCQQDFQNLYDYVKHSLLWRVMRESHLASHTLNISQISRGMRSIVDQNGFMLARHPDRRPLDADEAQQSYSDNMFAVLDEEDLCLPTVHVLEPHPRGEVATPILQVPGSGPVHIAIFGAQPVHAAPLPAPLPSVQTQQQHKQPAQRSKHMPVSVARNVRRQAKQDQYVATRNLRDVSTAAGLARLTALKEAMSAERWGVVAVQETKLTDTAATQERAGLVYKGELTKRSDKGRPCKGTGFFVRAEHTDKLAYFGAPKGARLVEGYGAVWAKWHGTNEHSDVWLASVYMPDVGKGRELHAKVVKQVNDSIE